MEKSVVQLIVLSATTNIWKPFADSGEIGCTGSGVIIDEEQLLILTNYHVIQQAKDISCRFANNEIIFPVQLLSFNMERDLALCKMLKTPDFQVKALDFSTQYPEMGDEVSVIGFPLGDELKMTKGIISGFQPCLKEVPGRTNAEATFQLQTSSPANYGDSGGALLSPDGLLIGIIDAGLPQANAISYAIPSPIILKELEKLFDGLDSNKPLRVYPEFWSIFTQPLTLDLKEWLKFKGEGILVTNVLSDSLFPDVNTGDIITHINDKTFVTPNMLEGNIYFKKYFQASNIENITVIRKGKKLKIKPTLESLQPTIRKVDFYLEQPEYFIMFGICFMILTYNHISAMAQEGNLENVYLLYNCDKPKVFVSYTFFDPLAILKINIINDVIYTINNKDPLYYFNHKCKDKYLTVITENKKIIHLKIDDKLDKEIVGNYNLSKDVFPSL